MPQIRWVVLGVAALLQLTVVVAVIGQLASDDRGARPPPPLTPAVPPIETPRPPEPRIDILYGAVREPPTGFGWRLIGQLSAHSVLVVEVETDRLHEAQVIAQQLVEPVKERYVEALVYFYRTRRPRTFAAKRVQWTPHAGYIKTSFPEH